MERLSLNPNIANDRISMPYPHIKVLNPSDAIALVVPSLPKGDLPVICEFDNTLRKIGSILPSALVLKSLKAVTPIEYWRSAEDGFLIKSSVDILEVL